MTAAGLHGPLTDLIDSWRGPDATLAYRCSCRHNLGQHTYSRGRCDEPRCDCSRFDRVDASR